MNANKLFSEFSLKKIWDKLLQHDKAMSSTILILTSGNWVEQEDGTFKNTVVYATFKDTDKLTVDLYDDGTLSETILTEYEQYIDGFEIINGALVATANTKPTQTMTVVVKGDFEVELDSAVVDVAELVLAINKVDENLGGYSFYNNPNVVYSSSDNTPYEIEPKHYVLSNSDTGKALLEDSAYISNTIEGNFYRIEGADSVTPFNSGGADLDDRKIQILSSLQNTNLELTEESTWDEIIAGIASLFPDTYDILANTYGKWTTSVNGASLSITAEQFKWNDGSDSSTNHQLSTMSSTFDITNYNTLVMSWSWSTTRSTGSGGPNGGSAGCTITLTNPAGNVKLFSKSAEANASHSETKTFDVSGLKGESAIQVTGHGSYRTSVITISYLKLSVEEYVES